MHYREQDEHVFTDGRQMITLRQLKNRLKALLPTHLSLIRKQHFSKEKAGRAERRALVHKEYLDKIEELLNISELAFEAKIKWEVGAMKIKARQSIQSFELVKKQTEAKILK